MWQPVLMISGYFISVLGLAMLFPAALDIYYSHAKWSLFITSSIVSVFIGLSLFLAEQQQNKKHIFAAGISAHRHQLVFRYAAGCNSLYVVRYLRGRRCF